MKTSWAEQSHTRDFLKDYVYVSPQNSIQSGNFWSLTPPIFLENQTEFCQTVPLHNKNKKIWKYSENNCLLGFTKIGENENVENLEKQSLLF